MLGEQLCLPCVCGVCSCRPQYAVTYVDVRRAAVPFFLIPAERDTIPRIHSSQLIDDAPYLLEPLIDGISDEPSMPVRCELLTATVKLFFKRPPGACVRACMYDYVAQSFHV